MIITYEFAAGSTYERTIREASILEDTSISSETVADRFSFCQEVCMVAIDEDLENQGTIGGPGEIVEIDECKIGRRKYHKGRAIEGSWILGFIQRNNPEKYRLEICAESERNMDALTELIKKHVAPGTELHTDAWRGYHTPTFTSLGYVHRTVNRGKNFVEPDSGAYTQNIESSWRWMSRELSRGGVRKENLAEHLCEFMWHRRNRKLKRDPFEQLLSDIKICYPGCRED